MKKSIVTFLICAISVFCTVGLSACSESCSNSCARFLFMFPIPTEQSVREDLNRIWALNLPDNISLVNYSRSLGRDGGTYYYIFNYDGNDEEFNTLLSSEKNKEFEKNFPSSEEPSYDHAIKNYFVKKYTFPDFSKDYLWLYQKNDPTYSGRRQDLSVLFFQSECKLHICMDDYRA